MTPGAERTRGRMERPEGEVVLLLLLLLLLLFWRI